MLVIQYQLEEECYGECPTLLWVTFCVVINDCQYYYIRLFTLLYIAVSFIINAFQYYYK